MINLLSLVTLNNCAMEIFNNGLINTDSPCLETAVDDEVGEMPAILFVLLVEILSGVPLAVDIEVSELVGDEEFTAVVEVLL